MNFGYIQYTEPKRKKRYVHHSKIGIYVYWKTKDSISGLPESSSGTIKLKNGKKIYVMLSGKQTKHLQRFPIELQCLGEKI